MTALDLDTDWTTPPRGDPPLLDVLEFERHRQFEGWTAVRNRRSPDFDERIENRLPSIFAIVCSHSGWLGMPD